MSKEREGKHLPSSLYVMKRVYMNLDGIILYLNENEYHVSGTSLQKDVNKSTIFLLCYNTLYHSRSTVLLKGPSKIQGKLTYLPELNTYLVLITKKIVG